MPDFHKFIDSAKDKAQKSSSPGPGAPPGPIQDAPEPPSDHPPLLPKLKGQPQVLGLASDPNLNRDSISACMTRFHDRVFWISRDCQLMQQDGRVQPFPIISSTASWTDCHPDGSPRLQQVPPGADVWQSVALRQYGQNSTDRSFFPNGHGEGHPANGGCDNGTRYAIWPDCPPVVASIAPQDGHITAYAVIKKAQIKGLESINDYPAASLHRLDYKPSHHGRNPHSLPDVKLLDPDFWPGDVPPYGNTGHVFTPDHQTVYLFGNSNGVTALAKVPRTEIPNKSHYQYWVNGRWVAETPHLSTPGLNIRNATAGGQGTYYYSPYWRRYVWIGGTPFPGAQFHIATAPSPEGPWTPPQMFWEAPNGNDGLGAYSLQANPGLMSDAFWRAEPGANGMFLTYTKIDDFGKGSQYTSPLVYVEWE
ncbi:hypothetical protein Tdes44962_MAKER06955 [Teratosphaeria destructans]|uniref:DUF4185 domain-containing protein n=1 Tax=Teratosphaeria destructans TaxID=418781 RepID=A0A9W7T0V9_9PEZI|nr:hypothetical protein Tdes44962_MAKER06955 [Teratosphaeria destructans]